MVRGSRMLMNMSREDQKLQEVREEGWRQVGGEICQGGHHREMDAFDSRNARCRNEDELIQVALQRKRNGHLCVLRTKGSLVPMYVA